jgi:hypothetical protein
MNSTDFINNFIKEHKEELSEFSKEDLYLICTMPFVYLKECFDNKFDIVRFTYLGAFKYLHNKYSKNVKTND